MSSLRHVTLVIETSKVYGRGLLDGIGRYAMAHGRWTLYVEERGLEEEASRLLRSWRGDGIVFRSTSRALVQAIRRKGVPAVDTNSAVVGHGFPLVYADEQRIAQLAVTHFRERRFPHFAFCAIEDRRWVQWRREAFLRELARLGLSRATLERKFAAGLQTTPRQAIVRAQLERVKYLLAHTNYPLEQIADWTGYKSQSHLSVVFKRETGATPGVYRKTAASHEKRTAKGHAIFRSLAPR